MRFRHKPTSVLWGARKGDWQIGGEYDRVLTKLSDDIARLRITLFRKAVEGIYVDTDLRNWR
jgi:hypothetical protein